MSDARDMTLKALDHAGTLIGKLGAIGGLKGIGLLGAAALLKTAAQAMRDRDEDLDEVLTRIKIPRSLRLPWGKSEEHTPAETPRSKKGT